MNRDEAVKQVEEGLTYLILSHAGSVASEQYAPSYTSDDSDGYIKEHKEWVAELRRIRQEFENLVTGLLEKV
ncbi:MAG: hypothetical protein PHO67_08945 [Candidatus Omnitrophica bacterium]|nr:hypothetical protein [Candidatus Omnitrophota bacterium]